MTRKKLRNGSIKPSTDKSDEGRHRRWRRAGDLSIAASTLHTTKPPIPNPASDLRETDARPLSVRAGGLERDRYHVGLRLSRDGCSSDCNSVFSSPRRLPAGDSLAKASTASAISRGFLAAEFRPDDRRGCEFQRQKCSALPPKGLRNSYVAMRRSS